MFLHLLFTLALLTMTVVCHPSLYLAEIADDENEDIIDNMMSILQEAEIANKTLTEDEMEKLAQDYSDYCSCHCSVSIINIYNGGGGEGGVCNCNCSPCSGGHADNGGGGGGGCSVSGVLRGALGALTSLFG